MSLLYGLFERALEPRFTSPDGIEDSSGNHVVDMFMHVTDDQVKTTILSQFASDTKLRVVIATSAFGMGIDAHCVIETIHEAPPRQFEEFVQQLGRTARDGSAGQSTLLVGQNSVISKLDETMRQYCEGKQCLRKILHHHFVSPSSWQPMSPLHECCSVCAHNCSCGLCAEQAGDKPLDASR